jgi:fatty-acyl-CoA synthase
MVVETKERDSAARSKLTHEITALMHEHFGINVIIDLVRPGTLPRTSSGKLSRFQSREAFLERQPSPSYSLPGPISRVRKTA